MMILYHSGKDNIVINVLSINVMSIGRLVLLEVEDHLLALDIQYLANRIVRLDIFLAKRILAYIDA